MPAKRVVGCPLWHAAPKAAGSLNTVPPRNGQLSERFMVAALKAAVRKRTAGSNPALPAIHFGM